MEGKVVVKALPVEDIVQDLAQQWQVHLKKDCGELEVQLPKAIGKGYVRGTSFQSGIGVIQYKCTFYQDYEIHFSKLEIHPLKFILCSKGIVQHSFQDEPQLHTVHTYQNVIVSSRGKKGHVLFFKGNQECHITSLEIIRNIFAKRKNHEFKDLPEELKVLFKDSKSRKQFFYHGDYSLRAAVMVEAIEKSSYQGFLRSTFLEAKILQMLVLQILQFRDDQNEGGGKMLRRAELEKIQSAAKLITTNLGKNYSVTELAKKVGTNINKLQEGFQILYVLSVNKYAQQKKLEAARRLLEEGNLNISQIVTKIGLNNRSYFARIFKNKYGVSPSYFRKKNKEDDIK